MGATSSITYLDLIQIYNLGSGKELNDISAIFADIDIDARVDKEILAATILDECGAMRPIYNTSPTFKFFSDNFFASNKDNISRMIDTLQVEYSPLESVNFNWTEETNINQNLDTDENKTETKSNTGTTTIGETGTEGTVNTGTQGRDASGAKTNTVSAMNDSAYQPDSREETSSSETRTDNLSELTTKNLSTERGDNLREDIEGNRVKNEALAWDEIDTHNERGSKGFAYQDLIQKELKIRQFSIYSWIAKKYAKELFLLVY